MYRRFYRNNLWNLADSAAALADHARLATAAEELARLANLGVRDVYWGAGFLCRCVTLADKDAQLDKARRKELTDNYADRALVVLRLAAAQGGVDAALLKRDPTLEPLQAREGFRKLLAELEEKAKK